MKFSEIANRLTGISTPLVGVSWQPTDLEVSAARRVIAFLEDRRVLYAPEEMEMPEHCVRSVLEIRHFLSGELGKLETKSEFAASLRAMRAACRKFLDRVGVDGREVTLYGGWPGLSISSFPDSNLWVPRSCAFCKAGNDAADIMRFSCPAGRVVRILISRPAAWNGVPRPCFFARAGIPDACI